MISGSTQDCSNPPGTAIARFPSSFPRPTSPVPCTWGTRSTTRCKIYFAAIKEWTDTAYSGCRAPITLALPPRTSSSASSRKKGISRAELGREKFIEKVWQWKQEAGNAILHQLKALGVSCDWSHERFTMDEGLSRAVREAFVKLWEDKLLYRAERLINWCPRCKTALADIEVVHEESDGHLWHIRYPLAEDAAQALVVATTRPETMLGDTAVAVHPDDKRYQHLIGKKIRLPITGRIVPLIVDPFVDREFGTGALKVTPGHDFNDFDIGERFSLDKISIFDADARIDAAAFSGRGENGNWISATAVKIASKLANSSSRN